MNCVECDNVLPVRVNADAKAEIKITKKPLNNVDIPIIYEEILCPNCDADNLWDRVNRNFISS